MSLDDEGTTGGFKDAQRRTLKLLEKARRAGDRDEINRLEAMVEGWWKMPDGSDPRDYLNRTR